MHEEDEWRRDERAEVVLASQVVALERPVLVGLVLNARERVTAKRTHSNSNQDCAAKKKTDEKLGVHSEANSKRNNHRIGSMNTVVLKHRFVCKSKQNNENSHQCNMHRWACVSNKNKQGNKRMETGQTEACRGGNKM